MKIIFKETIKKATGAKDSSDATFPKDTKKVHADTKKNIFYFILFFVTFIL
jgi:hypothetical protein